jgi:hypothetical protein
LYLLYIDDSGSTHAPDQSHCVLAGFSIFETTTHWICKEMDDIVSRYIPADPNIEFHGSVMHAGSKEWHGIPKGIRQNLMIDILTMVKNSYSKLVLFASVVNKATATSAGIMDISEHMFTQVVSRFDMFLGRKFKNDEYRARGIAIFDETDLDKKMQTLTQTFMKSGHQWGTLHNFCEVPLFLDSKMSRLIQLADLIAYSIYRHYAKGDSILYNTIKECFDKENNTIHGLRVDIV